MVRWLVAFGTLAGIVIVYRRWFHVNVTTVALTLLLLILVLAAEWELRYAVVSAFVATALYNYYFLPPLGTFTISDPQNWLALLAFLATAIIASRLSEHARNEAKDARSRQRELEVLVRLSREFLASENAGALLTSRPAAVLDVTGAQAVMLYLLEGDRLYQAGSTTPEVQIPHLRRLASTLTDVREDLSGLNVPIHAGVRPKGLLSLRDAAISKETAQAVGSLISIPIERALALESIARREAAKQSEQTRTLMMDSITHELRTPLTSIKGAATALLAGAVQPEEERELLSIIHEESDRLNTLVSKAVEMAQLDAQQMQMHFAPVRVAELVASSREACAWVEQQHPVRFEIDRKLEVRADPEFFQKVICNLLENAAKYSVPQTPITVMAVSEEGAIAVSVADQGVGIDVSEQPLIFERFYRSRAQAGSTAGTGMGLAISRAIVEAHGGSISVRSQPGQGSVFTIRIPTYKVPELKRDSHHRHREATINGAGPSA